MHDALLDLVPAALHGRSGGVLYSGRSAFERRRPLYLIFAAGGITYCPLRLSAYGWRTNDRLWR